VRKLEFDLWDEYYFYFLVCKFDEKICRNSEIITFGPTEFVIPTSCASDGGKVEKVISDSHMMPFHVGEVDKVKSHSHIMPCHIEVETLHNSVLWRFNDSIYHLEQCRGGIVACCVHGCMINCFCLLDFVKAEDHLQRFHIRNFRFGKERRPRYLLCSNWSLTLHATGQT